MKNLVRNMTVAIFAIILLSALICKQLGWQLIFVLIVVSAWGYFLYRRTEKPEKRGNEYENAFFKIVKCTPPITCLVLDTCTWMNLFKPDQKKAGSYAFKDFLDIAVERGAIHFVLISNVLEELENHISKARKTENEGSDEIQKKGKLARDARKYIDKLFNKNVSCGEKIIYTFDSGHKGPADPVFGEFVQKCANSFSAYFFVIDDAGARIQTASARDSADNNTASHVIGIMSTDELLGRINTLAINRNSGNN